MNTPPDTSSPRLRGTRPDAETSDRIYLVKACAFLHATYQVRLLALKASACGKTLVLKVPSRCEFDAPLRHLITGESCLIVREDLP